MNNPIAANFAAMMAASRAAKEAKPTPLSTALETIMKPGFNEPSQKEEEKILSDSVNGGLTTVEESVNTFPSTQEEIVEKKMTPQAQLLLGGGDGEPDADESPSFESLEGEVTPAMDGLHELARVDTTEMDPAFQEKKKALNVEAEKLSKKIQLASGEDVRTVLDNIDRQIETEPRLQGPALIVLRNQVQSIMVTLKARPEFDGIMIDKDIANIMRFIKGVRGEAILEREAKVARKTTRETKKNVKAVSENKTKSLMAGAFAHVMGGGFKK